jgi:hypothetical protein
MAKHMNNPFDGDKTGERIWEDHLDRLISTLTDNIESWGGYEEAYDSLIDFGIQLGGGGGPITVIPSRGSAEVCNPACLVLVKVGGKRNAAAQFDKLMRTLWEHLIECDAAKGIVIVTDWWDAKLFTDAHLGMFKAFHEKGRRFIFLSVGCPDTELAPIAIDLS